MSLQAGRIVSSFEASGYTGQRDRSLGPCLARRRRVHWPVALFLVSLLVPWVFYFGALRMSVYRIVLLVIFLPCLAMWMSGRAGRVRMPDIAILIYSFWIALSLATSHGFEGSIKSTGIVCIETLAPYMLARCYVRDADDLRNVVQLLFITVASLLPFAAFELVSGQNISRELFQLVLPTINEPPYPPRSGLTRVASVFDHPILYGAFTGSIFALVYLVLGYGSNFLRRAFMTGIVGVTSMMSLSSGPLIALFTQTFLLLWNGLLRTIPFRWKLLVGVVICADIAIELVANRSALEIIVSYFLFDPGSYWSRKLIWSYATESVLNYPVFGVGLNQWERPDWLMSSIDCFWLFQAVTYGLPAALLLALAYFSIFLSVGRKKGLDAREAACRTGFLITMAAFFLVAWTVSFWDAAYVIFMFLMGSGVWMLDVTARSRPELEGQDV